MRTELKINEPQEFDDYYEDRVHKSAGPVVFLSKVLSSFLLFLLLPLTFASSYQSSFPRLAFSSSNCFLFLPSMTFPPSPQCMAMLPVIWTDDEAESECKTYFNLYTFVVFLAW